MACYRLERLAKKSQSVETDVTVESLDDLDDDCDNDSVSTSDSSQIHHHPNISVHTPPLKMSPRSSMSFRSSRTPPGIGIKRSIALLQNVPQSPRFRNRFASDPHNIHSKTQSIGIQRSKPLSINKQKQRFDVDFGTPALQANKSYQSGSSDLFLFDDLNDIDCLDDEANFSLET